AALLTGGPAATASATTSASYTSGSSKKIIIDDIEIKPHMSFEKVRWDITFNNKPSGTFTGELKWIWKINHEAAEENNLYSAPTLQEKDTFYFKVDLHARFAAVDKPNKKQTDYLPIFKDNNGDIQ